MARVYLSRKEDRRGWVGVKECVTPECKCLHECLKNSQEWMIKSALEEKVGLLLREKCC